MDMPTTMPRKLRFHHYDGRVSECPSDIGHVYRTIEVGGFVLIGLDGPVAAIVTKVLGNGEYETDDHPRANRIMAAYNDMSITDDEQDAEIVRIADEPWVES